MAANTTPIFSRMGMISGSVVGNTAQTISTGTGSIGTNIFNVFTADTSGSFVQKIRFSAIANTLSVASTATVHRIFVSSVSAAGATTIPGTNTWLFQEVAAAAQTPTTTAGAAYIEVPLNFGLPAGYSILVNSSVVNNASVSWSAAVFGGNY